ncbi:HNH endonuclease signature motif containing protein [Gephyromycinifex aptenodytis]|uniref:HNH endonuclease signature motif containing protein n=1 Tax=Gephyromycinifex aptenodytis TaxID=2716227 RepID=UPI001445F5AE|nr:HNH endonuclease signature motif containing protein [Gephyromycinifex aptenodytis]
MRAVAEATAALSRAAQALQDLPDHLPAMFESEIPELFASLMQVRALCEGSAVALLHEADVRGVVAASDAAGPAQWMVQAAASVDVPVTGREASQFRFVAAECAEPGLEPLRDAAQGGRIRVTEAAAVAREFRALRREVEPELADIALQVLAEYCADGAGPRQIAEARDHIIYNYGQPQLAQERARTQYERRNLSGFRRDNAGMYVATVVLDPESHAVVEAALSALGAPIRDADGNPDCRLPGQRRADVIREMCAHLATSPSFLPEHRPTSPVRAQVVLTMAYDDLAAGLRAGTTGFDQPLPAASVRRLACDAGIIPAVLGTDNALLDLGRQARLASPAQVTAVRLRDKGCSFPGCDRPPGWCEVHHIVHWASGGDTDLGNLAMLCQAHHTLVHQRGYTATVTRGAVEWQTRPARWLDRAVATHPRTSARGNGGHDRRAPAA